MFSTISWSQFIIALAIASAAYYIVICALFYRQEIRSLLTGGIKRPDQEPPPVPVLSKTEDMDTPVLRNKIDEIQGILIRAGQDADRAGLIAQLKDSVASYSGLSLPAHRYALNLYIAKNAKEICGVDLEIDELEKEWQDLPR
jgi:hypothetical protein